MEWGRTVIIWTGGCSTTVVQQLEKPYRRTKCMFVEQQTWQCSTIVADDGRQLQQVHSLQPSTGELGHITLSHEHGTWMVYLHTPSVFHSLMVLSRDPDTIWRLSAENATLKTSFVWPTKRLVVRPLQCMNRNQSCTKIHTELKLMHICISK